jgi:hypothetical protein
MRDWREQKAILKREAAEKALEYARELEFWSNMDKYHEGESAEEYFQRYGEKEQIIKTFRS